MDYLKAVFWDYPKFTDAEEIRSLLRRKGNDRFYLWAMRRFLEYGRAVDTLQFFSLDQIREAIEKVPLTPYTQKKWKRILEVYAGS